MGLAFVVDPEAPTLARWLDHFAHAVAVMGIEHVGLGADFVDKVDDDALSKTRIGLEGSQRPTTFQRS